MLVPWPDRRCIVCERPGSLTCAHVIPAAIGGRLRTPFECSECNARLGYELERDLKNEAGVRLAIETLRHEAPELAERMLERALFVAHDHEIAVRARRNSEVYRVLDTAQADGSLVKDPQRARDDIETSLRRRGAREEEIAARLRSLEDAPEGERVDLGRGLAARKRATRSFSLDLSGRHIDLHGCIVAVAYRFLALVVGPVIFSGALDGVRELLNGESGVAGCRVDWLLARREYEPWHGIHVSSVDPHIVVHLRLFGKLGWDVAFTSVQLCTEPRVRTYEIDLTMPDGERVG